MNKMPVHKVQAVNFLVLPKCSPMVFHTGNYPYPLQTTVFLENKTENCCYSDLFQLSRQRFVNVREFRGKVLVDIREYYEPNVGDLKPGKKGNYQKYPHFFLSLLPKVKVRLTDPIGVLPSVHLSAHKISLFCKLLYC